MKSGSEIWLDERYSKSS